MTDYQKDKAAEKRAHKYRWFVWLFVPVVFLVGTILTFRNELVFLYYTRIFE